jgi:hypothetical protein
VELAYCQEAAAEFLVCRGVIPKARAFTSGPRDLPRDATDEQKIPQETSLTLSSG